MSKLGNELTIIYEPLDFSFLELKNITDILKCEPRNGPSSRKASPTDKDGKYLTKSLKLNNNHIEDFTDIPSVVVELFGESSCITWLDLSCNKIPAIPQTIAELQNLKILYLHGNSIKSFQEIQKLTKMSNLMKLTLHGNPLEQEKGYFHTVLSILPWLTSLDFTGISRSDHEVGNAMRRNRRKMKNMLTR